MKRTGNKSKIFQIGFNKCATTTISKLLEKATGVGHSQVHHYMAGEIASHIHSDINNNIVPLSRYQHICNTRGGDEEIIAYLDMENVFHTNGGLPIYAYEYFQELYEAYPNSKFILNIRKFKDWKQSRTNHNHGRYLEKYKYLTLQSTKQVNESWKRHFYSHIDKVMNFFDKNDKESLLIYDIDKNELSEIVDFLKDDLTFPNPPSFYNRMYKYNTTKK